MTVRIPSRCSFSIELSRRIYTSHAVSKGPKVSKRYSGRLGSVGVGFVELLVQQEAHKGNRAFACNIKTYFGGHFK